MKKLISFKKATQLCSFLFGLMSLFHLSIILGIVLFDFAPVNFLWGGRMKTATQLLNFEIISLIIMILCFFIVLAKSGKIFLLRISGMITIALWIIFLMFLFNTIGNILAKTTFEKLFSIVTIILAILCLRLAIEKNKK